MSVRRFDDGSTVPKRALQIYLVLIGAARRHEILTYEQLSTIMGFERGAGILADRLGPVMRWCDRNGLPALTAIVVNKTTGLPGEGLQTVGDNKFAAEQQKVFQYDWFAILPPEVSELT
jgi:hypothetical protein